MDERTLYDDFRDLCESRLDAAAAERLRARLAGDPALAADFDIWREVHAATSSFPHVPSSGVSFERLDTARRAGRIRRLRPWIAVAATLLVAAAGFAAWRNTRTPLVLLHSDLLAADAMAEAEPPEIPKILAAYRPVADGSVQWIDTIETGRAVASTVNRPILLWIYHPTCPLCVDMSRNAFANPDVDAKAAEFVPVRLDVMKLMETPRGQEFGRPLLEHNDWPYVGVTTPDGAKRVDFAGWQSPDSIQGHLTKALETQADLGTPLAWETANVLAGRLALAADAAKDGRMADAWRELTAVIEADPSGRFGAVARWRLRTMTHEAKDALSEAHTLAATDAAAGARRLSVAAERFRGTPYGTDLAEVEKELRATGRFPQLAEAASEKNSK